MDWGCAWMPTGSDRDSRHIGTGPAVPALTVMVVRAGALAMVNLVAAVPGRVAAALLRRVTSTTRWLSSEPLERF